MNHRIFNLVYKTAWNILPGAWDSLHAALQDRHETPLAGALDDLFHQRQPMQIDQNGIAHIDVQGVLGDLTPLEKQCGGTDYGDLANEFREARQSARGVMLRVNSPGGQAQNMVETAEEFRGLPSAAFLEGVGASSGYGLAVGADYIVTQPSALIGSIGTILPFIDRSGAWDKAGLKADYIVSGDMKGAGFPPSLTDPQREGLQQIVDDYFTQFRAHVLRFRAISDDSMRGQAFVGARGVKEKLADQTGTFDDAYNHLLKSLS